MKKITLLFLFLIGSITSSFGQFTEGFESGIPATWTVLNGGDTNTWGPFTTPVVFVLEGTTSALISYSATAHDDYLITPAIVVTAGVNDRFSFWARSFDVDYPEEFDLMISTTTPTAGAFTSIEIVAPDSAATTYTEYTYDLSAYVGQTIYIGMHSTTTDKWRISVDHVVSDALPAVAPDCATLTAPLNAATGLDYTGAIQLTWDAPTTGGEVGSYDVYLDTNTTPTTLLGNQTALTRNVTGLLPSTTYYWTVVPKNAAGPATGCTVFSFTTMANPVAPYCGPLTWAVDIEPISLVNFAGINNVTDATVDATPAHEAFATPTGAVTAGSSYTITLEGNTGGNFTDRFVVFADWNQDNDFADADETYAITQTITNSTGADAIQATQSLLVPPSALAGTTRMRVKKLFGTTSYTDPCVGGAYGQAEDYTLVVTAAPADLPDYVNLQYPPTATFPQGGSVVVYGQVYEGGLTDVAPNIVGQAPGIIAWVGYSTTDTNPNTWTNWIPTTWNSGSVGNNDEYQATLGAGLAVGTYYYATRFQLNGGAFVYGGIDPVTVNNPGNFWDGTTFKSGVLTITTPPPPANDECTGAIALTPGGVFADNAVSGTTFNATDDAVVTPSCAFLGTQNSEVWYTVVVPASGSLTIETQAAAANSLGDTTIAAFSGTCGSLTEVDCDDDSGTGLLSLLSLTGLTAGDTLYIGVWKWGTDAPTIDESEFRVSAYDASLANGQFDNANFSYYPNPVKNVLNLSYSKEISNVEVFNLLGQKVSANDVNATDAQIDMSNLSNGAYMVKVTSDNQIRTIKVIKQ